MKRIVLFWVILFLGQISFAQADLIVVPGILSVSPTEANLPGLKLFLSYPCTPKTSYISSDCELLALSIK